MLSVVTPNNEVVGFPDTTDKNTIESVIKGDLYGEIRTPKKNWYKDKIQPVLESTGMSIFQPTFVGTTAEPDRMRAFTTSYAKDASFGIFDATKQGVNKESIQEHPVAAWVGSFVGQTQAILSTGAAGKSVGIIKELPKLTTFGESIVSGAKLGALYGAIRESVSEVNRSIEQDTHPDIIKIGTAALKDAGVFALYGAAGSAVPSKPIATAAVAGTAYGISKLEGASEEDALLNAAVMGTVHFVMSKEPSEKTQKEILNNLEDVKSDYIKSMNPSINDNIVNRTAQEHTMNVVDEIKSNEKPLTTKEVILNTAEEILDIQKAPKESELPPVTTMKTGEIVPLEIKPKEPSPTDYATAEEYVASKINYNNGTEAFKKVGDSSLIAEVTSKGKVIISQKTGAKAKGGMGGGRGYIGQEAKEFGSVAEATKWLEDNGWRNQSDLNLSHSQLTAEWETANKARTSTPVKPPIVENIAPTSESPEGKVSKAASDINKEIVRLGFEELPPEELARYTPQKKAEQLAIVEDMVTNNWEQVKEMLKGKEPIPADVNTQVLFNAAKNKAMADMDIETVRDLANSPIATERSIAAQKLGGAGYDNGISEGDPIKAINELQKVRQTELEKKIPKEKIENQKKEAITKIKKIKKEIVKKQDWEGFLRSLEC